MTTITRLSTAETAKLLRAELKRVFPTTKFSVRSHVYSMGSSIYVRWEDGPTPAQVREVSQRFRGADFDGMQDLKTYRGPQTINGERYEMGADYVFEERSLSPELAAYVAAQVNEKWGTSGINVSVDNNGHWQCDYTQVGSYTGRELCYQLSIETPGDILKRAAKAAAQATAVEAPAVAPTAAPAGEPTPYEALDDEDGQTEVIFVARPAWQTRRALGPLGFRWDGPNGRWRAPGYVSTAQLVEALGYAPSNDRAPAASEPDDEPSEPVGGYAYEHLQDFVTATPEQIAQRDAENEADALDFLRTTGDGPTPRQQKPDSVAYGFTKAAATARAQAEKKRNSGIYNQNPTRRRMGQLASIEADAERLERLAAALDALAAQRSAGTLPPILAAVTTKAMAERLLLTQHMPSPEWDKALWTAFVRAGITAQNYGLVRAALLPLAEPAPRETPLERQIRDALRALIGVPIPGYFPTPTEVVARLLGWADIRGGMAVLEPSAGAGHIADAIRAAHPDVTLHCIEWAPRLADILKLKGHRVIGDDALDPEVATMSYDRIVMNPPFEDGQDAIHVRTVYENLLAPDGRLVAVMSASPFFRDDRRSREFRAWLDARGGEVSDLPAGAFLKSDRPTGVATKLVVIDGMGGPRC